MWQAESPKNQKFRIVVEAEFSPNDRVDESLCAKITQKVLSAFQAHSSVIHPTSFKVVQVEKEST